MTPEVLRAVVKELGSHLGLESRSMHRSAKYEAWRLWVGAADCFNNHYYRRIEFDEQLPEVPTLFVKSLALQLELAAQDIGFNALIDLWARTARRF